MSDKPIKRYRMLKACLASNPNGCLDEHGMGKYMLFADHERDVAARVAEAVKQERERCDERIRQLEVALAKKDQQLAAIRLQHYIIATAYQRFAHLDQVLSTIESDDPIRKTAGALWQAIKGAAKEGTEKGVAKDAEIAAAVAAERKRCREKEVEPLRLALGDMTPRMEQVVYTEAMAHCCSNARSALAAVQKIQEENP